jgi:hypothetical protein
MSFPKWLGPWETRSLPKGAVAAGLWKLQPVLNIGGRLRVFRIRLGDALPARAHESQSRKSARHCFGTLAIIEQKAFKAKSSYPVGERLRLRPKRPTVWGDRVAGPGRSTASSRRNAAR